MSLRFKAVVFDFDGVLMDSSGIKTACYRKFAESYGRFVDEFVDYHIANGGLSRHVKIRYYFEHVVREPLSADQESILVEKYAACVAEAMETAELVQGAKECLEWLKSRTRIFLLSGTPQDELVDIVRRQEIAGFFERIIGYPSTKPETLKAICLENEWSGPEVLYVGDALSDYQAASRAGTEFMGIVTRENAKLFSTTAFRKIDGVSELSGMLELW